MTRRARSGAVLLALVPLCGVVALGGAPVWAQGQVLPGWTFLPSLTLSGEYDSNVEGSASNPKSDIIGTISPGLGLTFIGQKFSFFANYSVDGELYADRSDLNNFGENQRASLSSIYVPDPLTTLGLDLNFIYTNNSLNFLQAPAPRPPVAAPVPAPTSAGPGQVRPPTVAPTIGVDVGRQQSWTLGVSPYVSRQFGPSTSGTLGYSYTHTDVDGGPSGSEHQVSLGAARAFTAVDQGSLRYVFRAFLEEESDTEISHSLLVGWGRQLGPLTNFSIEAGPHFQDSDVSLEANVQLSHAFERGSAGLSYSRSQELVIGQAGAPIVDTVTASVGYQALRDLTVGVSASFSNIAVSNGPDTQEYAFTALASYPLTTWAVASLSYQFTLEDDSSDKIYRHVVTLALTFTYPMRLR